MRAALVAVLVAAVLVAGGAMLLRDDDHPVDPDTPAARQAAATALEVVPGRVIEVARDEDNGKWEVTIRQDDRDYEVELDPRDLSLLRLDFD